MTEDEKIAMIKLLRQLPKQKQREFYYMIKGAAFAAKKTKTAQEEQQHGRDNYFYSLAFNCYIACSA